MIPARIEELQRLCDAATPGSWRVEDYRKNGDWRSTGLIWAHTEEQYFSPGKCVTQIDCRKLHSASPPEEIAEFEANAAFIAASRTAVPDLLRAVRILTDGLEGFKLGHIHEAGQEHIRVLGDNYGWCDFCHTKVSFGPGDAETYLARASAALSGEK